MYRFSAYVVFFEFSACMSVYLCRPTALILHVCCLIYNKVLVLRSVHPFCISHPFTQPPNPILYNAFQSARHPKVPLREASAPHLMRGWTHSTQHPKQYLDRFSRFCTAHGRESLYFTMGRHSPLKIAASHGDLDLHLIHGSLGQLE